MILWKNSEMVFDYSVANIEAHFIYKMEKYTQQVNAWSAQAMHKQTRIPLHLQVGEL